MNQLILTHIFIYPIKSLGGISLQSASVEERGLQHDRRWMLVDKNGMFLTQREHPQMALLQVSIKDELLEVAHKIKKISKFQIPISSERVNSIVVSVWNDVVIAKHFSEDCDLWFSEALNMDCQLVFMDDASERSTDTKHTPEPKQVSFADAFPFLIIGQESLNDLNRRLKEPLSMNRFRPNLVFSGGEPFTEDTWQDFMIGDLKFRAVKQCSRCVITTINQDTSEKKSEPLKTLAKFRKAGNNVNFGQNLVAYDTGILRVGNSVIP